MELKDKTQTFLTCQINNEQFAINVSHVVSILEVTTITQMPNTPSYIEGVINLRGEVLPIINTRIKFGMPKIDFTSTTCIIVIETEINGEIKNIGALVDSVHEVIDVEPAQIQPVPTIGTKYNCAFLDGMIQNDSSFTMLLNTQKVFYTDELIDIDKALELNEIH